MYFRSCGLLFPCPRPTIPPVNPLSRSLQLVCRFLDVGQSPAPSDCIFVLAGRHQRKLYGLDLWRRGFAPRLILSVGRFEWRKYYHLGLPSDGGLKSLVDQTPPSHRHFFVFLNRESASSSLIRRGRFGTLSEARALAEQFRNNGLESLLVVSSAIHLRRVALAFRRAFRSKKIRLTFAAVPEAQQVPSEIWLELKKYLVYLFLWPKI